MRIYWEQKLYFLTRKNRRDVLNVKYVPFMMSINNCTNVTKL